jgi:hypothetical protein
VRVLAVPTLPNASNDQLTLSEQLSEELRHLRKGSGISSWKLTQSTYLRSALAGQAGLEDNELSAIDMLNLLAVEFDRLGDSIEARATRNAFGLDRETQIRKLSDRRAEFAERLGRHPDTIENYENRGIAEIVQRLVGTAAIPAASSHTFKPAAGISTDPARTMISHGLDAIYGLGDQAIDILKNLDGAQGPFLDASIELHLTDSPRGPEWYTYNLRYIFTSSLTSYRIAVARRPHDTEILSASGLVDEVMQLDRNGNLDTATADIMQRCRYSVYDQPRATMRPLSVHNLDHTEMQDINAKLWQIDPVEYRIFAVVVPPELAGRSNRFDFFQSFDLSTSEPYAWWSAPGLMYINNILIDTSSFQPFEHSVFYIQPFLGQLFAGTLDSGKRKFSISARGWIMQGHGLAIIWKGTAPAQK